MQEQYFNEFFEYLKKGTSPFHVVQESIDMLKEAGFEPLHLKEAWGLQTGGKYYVEHHGSTLFAFTVGKKMHHRRQLRIAASHGDFPCLRIKTNPEMTEEGYKKINVEMYGGLILNTWLDRPLSVAGRVALRSDDVFHPEVRYVDFQKPLMTVPNIAIHINREINKGVELNRQTDMIPICGMMSKEEKEAKENKKEVDFFMESLAKELGVCKEDILDFELSVYNLDEPMFVGLDDDFISAPRLDNLNSSFALMKSITTCERDQGINMAIIFDHEEIGSETKQGAASVLLSMVLEKIYDSLGITRTVFLENISDSFILSVDVSHGYHPNYGNKYDPTTKSVLGGGICVKEAASQSYATDCEAIAVVQQICEQENIAYQKSVNRSDGTGGSTLGAITGTLIPTNIVDVGVPLLAMHSAREIMGTSDQIATQQLVDKFFTLS